MSTSLLVDSNIAWRKEDDVNDEGNWQFLRGEETSDAVLDKAAAKPLGRFNGSEKMKMMRNSRTQRSIDIHHSFNEPLMTAQVESLLSS